MSIDKIISAERKTLDEDHKWSVLSMFINSDGKMNTEFDYVDISENAIAYEQNWIDRHLK